MSVAPTAAAHPQTLDRADRIMLGLGLVAIALAAFTRFADVGPVPAFVCSVAAVAVLAALVGRSVEQLGDRLGAGATGVLQSALGNLPELFIGLFALRAGLVQVVQAAIIGSVLGNALLVLGLAFVVGGLRHGVQRFDSQRARTISALLLVALTALAMPGIASYVHTPAAGHERELSSFVAVILLIVFALSLPSSLQRGGAGGAPAPEPPRWPAWLAIAMLAASAAAAAFVSDWFVEALQPAIQVLHISQAFAGLVIVAIASNAVENVVGIQLAGRGRADYALSVVVNSPLQVALVLAPVLVLAGGLLGGATLTLVFSPLLLVAVALAVVAVTFIIFDARSTWLEGVALLALYVVIAAAFWWG